MVTTALSVFFSLLQLQLISGETFGIPDLWFSLGDTAIASFVMYIQFLPMVIMYSGKCEGVLPKFAGSRCLKHALFRRPLCQLVVSLGMCPDGSEGASYAMLTTLSNMGGTVASDVSTLLAGIWNVSDKAIEKGHYSGMRKLTILTSLIQIAPLPLLFLIPKDKAEQTRLQKSDESSFVGGAVFIGVLAASLSLTVVENAIEIA